MLPSEIQKYLDEEKHSPKEKLRNIKYMFMRDLHQSLNEINNMKVPEVLAYLKRLEEDAKETNKPQSKSTKRMG